MTVRATARRDIPITLTPLECARLEFEALRNSFPLDRSTAVLLHPTGQAQALVIFDFADFARIFEVKKSG